MSFNHTKTPTARTQHRCDECSRTIETGEKYHRTAAVWEGDFFTNVACLHCAAAREIVARWWSDYRDYYYHGLHDWLSDLWGEEVWSARLYAMFRADWRYQSGALMPVPELEAIR